jgi:hypothetical protein
VANHAAVRGRAAVNFTQKRKEIRSQFRSAPAAIALLHRNSGALAFA